MMPGSPVGAGGGSSMATAVAVAACDCMVAAGISAADISGSYERDLRARSVSKGDAGVSELRAKGLAVVEAAGRDEGGGAAAGRVAGDAAVFSAAGLSIDTWLRICSS